VRHADLTLASLHTNSTITTSWGTAMSFGEFLLSIFWFMLLAAWIWLLISILTDIFRDDELSGWGKALWVLFLIVVPWLGALVYLIARGRAMNERVREHEHGFRGYTAPSSPSIADELTKLADLRDRGRITPDEFVQAKNRLLGTATHESTPVG